MESSLRITPITEQDTDWIVKWRNNENVRKNFIFQQEFTREIHMNWLKTRVLTGDTVQFIIQCDGVPIGSTYLRDIDHRHEKAEFGIFIGEDAYRGKGLGTQATALILKYGFEELKLNKIFLRVLCKNIAAVKTYQKAGFQSDGVFREDVRIDGQYYDILFMSILKKEWSRLYG